MNLQVDVNGNKEFLSVVLSGKYDLKKAIDSFPFILEGCKETKKCKALIDFRGITSRIESTEKFIYAVEITELYSIHLNTGGENVRFAYVGPPEQISSYEPGQEYANKSGIDMILTADYEAAVEWLTDTT